MKKAAVIIFLMMIPVTLSYANTDLQPFAYEEPSKEDIERFKCQDAMKIRRLQDERDKRNKIVGMDFARGSLENRDYLEASHYLRGAADAGDVESEYLLGLILGEGGHGVVRDPVKAARWFKAAAEHGHAEAQVNLALRYDTRWISEEKVANLEKYCGLAPSNLSDFDKNPYDIRCAEFSSVVANTKTPEERREQWLKRERGGLAPDDTSAADWYRKAADQGIAQAAAQLGLFYETGRGVEKNLEEAYFWYSVMYHLGVSANNSGTSQNAETWMKNVSVSLTQKQLEVARKRVSTWKPAKAP